jgi:hypothetical protein
MSRASILVLRCSRLVGNSVVKSAGLMEVARTWRTLTHDLADPYRPERHYMRGPGPKWREKHSNDRLFQS